MVTAIVIIKVLWLVVKGLSAITISNLGSFASTHIILLIPLDSRRLLN